MSKLIATQDVHYEDLLSLATSGGPVGQILLALGKEWAEEDPARLTKEGPRIGTVSVYRFQDGSLHIDFVPRHSNSIP